MTVPPFFVVKIEHYLLVYDGIIHDRSVGDECSLVGMNDLVEQWF